MVLLWDTVVGFEIHKVFFARYIDALVQERRNSNALAMELHLSCTDPLLYIIAFHHVSELISPWKPRVIMSTLSSLVAPGPQRLPLWQPLVQPMTTKLASSQLFNFSVFSSRLKLLSWYISHSYSIPVCDINLSGWKHVHYLNKNPGYHPRPSHVRWHHSSKYQ